MPSLRNPRSATSTVRPGAVPPQTAYPSRPTLPASPGSVHFLSRCGSQTAKPWPEGRRIQDGWLRCSLFPFPLIVLSVGQHIANIQALIPVIDLGDQSVFIAFDVEHSPFAHGVGVRKCLSHIHQILPGGRLRNSVHTHPPPLYWANVQPGTPGRA